MKGCFINKKYRLRVAYFLLIAVMAPVACSEVTGICSAAQNECEKLLSQDASKSIGKDKVKQIQDSLVVTGFDPKEIDGIIGPHSEAALKQFCVEFENEFRKSSFEELIATLFLYAAIAKEDPKTFPEWKKIALSPDFKLWINKQPAEKRARIYKIRYTGTPQQIISLFERYLADREQAENKTPKPVFDRTDESITSFMLTDQDIEKLQAEDDIVSKLEKLQDKSFDSEDEFLKALQEAVKPISEQFKKYQDLIVKSALLQSTYTLTKSSFLTLKKGNIPDPLIEELQNLQNIEYPDKNEFVKAVQPVIDGVEDKFNQYAPAIIASAKVAGTYRVTAEFLQRLKEKDIPAGLIEKLRALQDKPFADKNEFKKAVGPIIEDITIGYNFPDDILSALAELKKDGLADQRTEAQKIIKRVIEQYNNYQSIILKEIEGLPNYMLTDQSYAILKEGGLPDYINSAIHALKNKGYSDENLFENALKDKITGLAAQYRTRVLKAAEKLETYRLTGLSLKKLQKELGEKKIPQGFFQVMEELQGVDYPGQNLFMQAWVSKINGLYRSLAMEIAKDQRTYKLTKEFLEQLQDKLQAEKIPDGLVERLRELPDITYADEDRFKDALNPAINAFTAELTYDKEAIVKTAKKIHEFKAGKNDPQQIQWKGEPCGCVLDELSEKMIYGFYPFWLADQINGDKSQANTEPEKKKVPQQFDFSVLSRIGYYAQPINKKGKLALDSDWQIKKGAKFIKAAHKYRTKVDLVIYNVDWDYWSQTKEIDEITTAIVSLVKSNELTLGERARYLITTFPWNWFSNYSRLGAITDGITIDFDGYPTDPSSVKAFVKLIAELRRKLKQSWQDYFLNIMLPMDTFGEGVYSYDNLLNIVINEDENRDAKLFLLVFINEPTTNSKKLLRNKIERNFHGNTRLKILRKIVPVITYAGGSEELSKNEKEKLIRQLEDDILYGKENFGGIGFWPVPRTSTKGSADVYKAVRDAIEVDVKDVAILQKYISKACIFICPNRMIFRIAMDIAFAVLVILVFFNFVSCKFRNWYNRSEKYFWIFLGIVVLSILLIFSLLYCDPYYKTLRQGNWPLFLVIAIVIGMAIFQYFKKLRLTRSP